MPGDGGRTPTSLADTQAEFYALVTAPEGVAKALAERGLDEGGLGRWVVGDGRLSPVQRLDIYANMYFYRILDVLLEAYPKLLAVLGEVEFHNLVTDYLVAQPPAHPSIADAGGRLPAFIDAHPASQERPWLGALARLERAYVELFDGPDAEALTFADLRARNAGEMAALRLELVPCHAVLEHPHPIGALWSSLEAGSSVPPAGSEPEALLVWRQDVRVYHRPVAPAERPLLAHLDKGGCTLAALCDHVGEGGVIEDAARYVFETLRRWVSDGLLVRHRG
jgi:hypothetical protein